MRWLGVAGLALLAVAAGCAGDVEGLAELAILAVDISDTTNGETSIDGDSVTRLYEVTGDWEQVSIEIARAVKDEGWTITGVACVGTGNDVIAKKYIDDRWVLLEAGAGGRGAGIILRTDPDQTEPTGFSVTGPCARRFVSAAG